MDKIKYYKKLLENEKFLDISMDNKTIEFLSSVDKNFKYDYVTKDNKIYIRIYS